MGQIDFFTAENPKMISLLKRVAAFGSNETPHLWRHGNRFYWSNPEGVFFGFLSAGFLVIQTATVIPQEATIVRSLPENCLE